MQRRSSGQFRSWSCMIYRSEGSAADSLSSSRGPAASIGQISAASQSNLAAPPISVKGQRRPRPGWGWQPFLILVSIFDLSFHFSLSPHIWKIFGPIHPNILIILRVLWASVIWARLIPLALSIGSSSVLSPGSLSFIWRSIRVNMYK